MSKYKGRMFYYQSDPRRIPYVFIIVDEQSFTTKDEYTFCYVDILKYRKGKTKVLKEKDVRVNWVDARCKELTQEQFDEYLKEFGHES